MVASFLFDLTSPDYLPLAKINDRRVKKFTVRAPHEFHMSLLFTHY